MFGSEILDVAIGLALVFLLLSLVCSAIREIVEGWFKTRAVYLEQGIRELLGEDGNLVEAVYNHPMIAGLFRGKYQEAQVAGRKPYNRTKLPAYIPAGSFAQALLDIAARGRTAPLNAGGPPTRITVDGARGGLARITTENVRSTIQNIGHAGVERVILSALDRANGDVAQAQMHIEAWFNGSMDRISGWYKRRTQVYLFAFGGAFAFGLNADTIKIARHLYRDESARAAMVAMADAAVRDTSLLRAVGRTGTGSAGDSASAPPPSKNPGAALTQRELLRRLDSLQLPLGWGENAPGWHLPRILVAVLGWLMTAAAVSLGAPFWFDLLNKFMVVRSTVKPHEKSPEEGSEDRQTLAERSVLRLIGPQAPAVAPPAPALPPAGPAPHVPSETELVDALPTKPAMGV